MEKLPVGKIRHALGGVGSRNQQKGTVQSERDRSKPQRPKAHDGKSTAESEGRSRGR